MVVYIKKDNSIIKIVLLCMLAALVSLTFFACYSGTIKYASCEECCEEQECENQYCLDCNDTYCIYYQTLSFDAGDGSEIACVLVNGNNDFALPNTPAKNGYEFLGWYLDYGIWQIPLTRESLDNALVSGQFAITVYARWQSVNECKYFTLTIEGGSAYCFYQLEANGWSFLQWGSFLGSFHSSEFAAGSKVFIVNRAMRPTQYREFYSFVGWFDGETLISISENNFVFTTPARDVTLTQEWSRINNPQPTSRELAVNNLQDYFYATFGEYYFSSELWAELLEILNAEKIRISTMTCDEASAFYITSYLVDSFHQIKIKHLINARVRALESFQNYFDKNFEYKSYTRENWDAFRYLRDRIVFRILLMSYREVSAFDVVVDVDWDEFFAIEKISHLPLPLFPITWYNFLTATGDYDEHFAGRWITLGNQRNIGVTCVSRIPVETQGVIYHIVPFSYNFLLRIHGEVVRLMSPYYIIGVGIGISENTNVLAVGISLGVEEYRTDIVEAINVFLQNNIIGFEAGAVWFMFNESFSILISCSVSTLTPDNFKE